MLMAILIVLYAVIGFALNVLWAVLLEEPTAGILAVLWVILWPIAAPICFLGLAAVWASDRLIDWVRDRRNAS